MSGAVEKAQQLVQQIPGAFLAGQFTNPANPQAHFETTGPEIWQDTEGHVDVFVAGVGTGGTITGVGRYLKSQDPAVRIVGVEPAASPLLSKGTAGPHKIQGIGANFVPQVLDTAIYDELLAVTDQDAFGRRAADGTHRGRAGGHLLRSGSLGGGGAGQAPGKSRQDHRDAAAGHRRPLPVHRDV